MKRYYVYFMVNQSNKVLYTGMTNKLNRRVAEHKNKRNPRSFTERYNCNKLVYYEVFSTPMEAIRREKQYSYLCYSLYGLIFVYRPITFKTGRKMTALIVLIIGASLALLAGLYVLLSDKT